MTVLRVARADFGLKPVDDQDAAVLVFGPMTTRQGML
jgi:hypothetical protein